ncbi:MAG: hypothetical protein B7C24_10095 [Bacteroidetes bacterium 4572_77]|nr:MAG: hypothetical protein B7C24_10095 [Bacteroidetes bacterium 4572_77]
MPNNDKNPFPNDIPKKKPPHEEAGQEWKWEPNDESKGVNPGIKSEFDNENIWYEAGYTDEDNKRSYTGKHLEHEYPHISIHGKSGTLKAKHGYMYRLFDCTMTELTIEGACIIYCRDCKIDKVTGAGSNGNARIHFTNCEIKDVDSVSKCKMVFDRETKFKPPSGSAQFNSLSDCSVQIYSKPEWTLSSAKQFNSLSDCDITVSGPSCIHNNSGQAIVSGLVNCNFTAMGQWLATEGKGGCAGGPGTKIFDGVTESNILTVDTQINNPDPGGALCSGMSKSTFTSIDPDFIIHATGYAGSESHTAHIGGKYENCDVIHFHITDGSNCCVNTELTGSPGAGSMMETGSSDRSSLVVAGGKVDVEDNAAPVLKATDCSMRFYDCETVHQKGSQDLSNNDDNCISRYIHNDEIKSDIKKIWNEQKDCRVDVVGNKKIEALVDDMCKMSNGSIMTMKYNCLDDKAKAKKKLFHIVDHSALSTERNGKMEADEEQALVAETYANISLNEDETIYSKQHKHAFEIKDKSKIKSRKGLLEGKDSLYCIVMESDSEMLSEYDTIKSKHHAIQMADSKMDMRFPDVDVKHDGYHGSTSYIDVVEGRIKTQGEEFTLSECEGTIKHVNLEGEKTIQLEGKNSFYTFNQTTRYIIMSSKDKLECEKMTNLIDITGTDCIFKVREGECLGDISIHSERTETWLHNLTVTGSTSIDANLCKLFGCNFKALSITGGQLQTGGNTALATSYTSDLGLLSDDTYTSLSCKGNYIMNNIGGGSISVDGLAFYQNCPDILSEPYKKGVYSSDDLDIFAKNEKAGMSIKEEAGMSIESKAGMNIKEEAGGMIEEKAGGMASTIASRIIHNG